MSFRLGLPCIGVVHSGERHFVDFSWMHSHKGVECALLTACCFLITTLRRIWGFCALVAPRSIDQVVVNGFVDAIHFDRVLSITIGQVRPNGSIYI